MGKCEQWIFDDIKELLLSILNVIWYYGYAKKRDFFRNTEIFTD